MSGPDGSTFSCVSDEDTQRMVEGGRGVNPRCPCDQETSSLGSEDAPSRVDTIGVIT